MKNMVKTIGVIAALLIFTPVCSASIEASSEQSGSSWIVTDTNFMKLFFTSSWGKIKNISPKPVRQTFGYTIVTTAGIRGAESVDTLLNPYWKDDLSDDQKYKDEVEMFTRGHELATGGDIKNAIIAFEGFIDNYPESNLVPNAKFALGIAYSEFGKQGQAVRILSEFVEQNQAHLLVADAKQLLEMMI